MNRGHGRSNKAIVQPIVSVFILYLILSRLSSSDTCKRFSLSVSSNELFRKPVYKFGFMNSATCVLKEELLDLTNT